MLESLRGSSFSAIKCLYFNSIPLINVNTLWEIAPHKIDALNNASTFHLLLARKNWINGTWRDSNPLPLRIILVPNPTGPRCPAFLIIFCCFSLGVQFSLRLLDGRHQYRQGNVALGGVVRRWNRISLQNDGEWRHRSPANPQSHQEETPTPTATHWSQVN